MSNKNNKLINTRFTNIISSRLINLATLSTILISCSSNPSSSDNNDKISYLESSDKNLAYKSSTKFLSNVGMEYVNVPDKNGNNKKFSRIIMGTDHLLQAQWTNERQKLTSETEFNKLLDEAVRLGINTFDSSPIYVGNVESNFDKWVKLRNQNISRDNFYYNKKLNPDRKIYSISKGGFPFDLYNSKWLDSGTHSKEILDVLTTNNVLDSNLIKPKNNGMRLNQNTPAGTYSSRLYGSKEQITHRVSDEINNIREHLSNLTVFLMHRDDSDFFKFNQVKREQTPVKTILESLNDPKIKSKYDMIGLSNWKTQRVNESLALANKYPNLPKPVLNSPYFSLFEMSDIATIHAGGVQVFHRDMMNKDFEKGIKMMTYSPLGGFSILDKPEPRWENAKKAAKEKFDIGDAYWQNVYYAIFSSKNQERYYRVVEFTKKFNVTHKTDYTIDQMINAYALAHVRADFLTVGPINIDQLRRTVNSIKLSHILTTEDLEYLYNGN